MIKRLINWLKKIFRIKDNKPIKVVYTGTTSTEMSLEEKARIKREKRKEKREEQEI